MTALIRGKKTASAQGMFGTKCSRSIIAERVSPRRGGFSDHGPRCGHRLQASTSNRTQLLGMEVLHFWRHLPSDKSKSGILFMSDSKASAKIDRRGFVANRLLPAAMGVLGSASGELALFALG